MSNNSVAENNSAKESDYASSDRSYPDVEYYQEDDLPNFNFRKFVIPRGPGSDFSTDILKIIKRNAAQTPRTALKLMQICKYFCHEEFPFLPVKYIKCYDDYGLGYETLQGQEVEYADPTILKLFKKKLWMTNEIFLDFTVPINSVLRHVVACDLMELSLQDQNLLIDQFKFLTDGGKLKKLWLHTVSLNYENEDPVPLEEILKCIPNIEEFVFKRSTFHHENVSNFIQVLNPEKLNFFAFGKLSESFDFETFIGFITKYPKIQYSLKFKKGIPNKFFKKLQNFVEDIRKAGSYSRYAFSRIYCKNQTWRYGHSEWSELPHIFCICDNRRTLHSNYDPPYYYCDCKKYLTLASTEAWNKQFREYFEKISKFDHLFS